jgi:hypothetical protein
VIFFEIAHNTQICPRGGPVPPLAVQDVAFADDQANAVD